MWLLYNLIMSVIILYLVHFETIFIVPIFTDIMLPIFSSEAALIITYIRLNVLKKYNFLALIQDK